MLPGTLLLRSRCDGPSTSQPDLAVPPLESSPRTLERWRWLKIGPAYLRAGGRILYRLEDIEAYERANPHLTAISRRSL